MVFCPPRPLLVLFCGIKKRESHRSDAVLLLVKSGKQLRESPVDHSRDGSRLNTTYRFWVDAQLRYDEAVLCGPSGEDRSHRARRRSGTGKASATGKGDGCRSYGAGVGFKFELEKAK